MRYVPYQRCQTCHEPYVDHVPAHPWNNGRGVACATFVPFPRATVPTRLAHLPAGYKMLMPGEVIGPNDYLQIGTSYHATDTSIWTGETVEAPIDTWNRIFSKV